jgi:polygalacturonase
MGPSWNIHFIYSKDIITCGCFIHSEGVSNGDGWDPDSSEDCVCFNNDFKTHDDGIAIKSGKNPQGNIINRPTKNVRVFDCRGRNSVAIGSELSGGIENVYVWDCDYQESVLGVNIKTTEKRGGYVKNVKAKNCKFVGIGVRTKYGCNNDGEGSGYLTEIENISFEDIYFYGRKPEHIICPDNYRCPIYFDGFDGEGNQIKGLTLKNIFVQSRPDGKNQKILIKNVKDLVIEDVDFE